MTDEPNGVPPESPVSADTPVSEPHHASGAEAEGAPGPSDTLVQTALRLLPVPEHAPGFWEDLHLALAAEPRRQVHEPSLAVGPGGAAARVVGRTGVGSAGAPRQPQRLVAAPAESAPVTARRAGGEDPARRLVPPSLRRRSNVVLLVLLVAAVALVVLCSALLVRSRGVAGLGPSPSAKAANGAAASPAG